MDLRKHVQQLCQTINDLSFLALSAGEESACDAYDQITAELEKLPKPVVQQMLLNVIEVKSLEIEMRTPLKDTPFEDLSYFEEL